MTPYSLSGAAAAAFEPPLKRPFVTAQGRKTSTVNVGLTLRLKGGAQGYGERQYRTGLRGEYVPGEGKQRIGSGFHSGIVIRAMTRLKEAKRRR